MKVKRWFVYFAVFIMAVSSLSAFPASAKGSNGHADAESAYFHVVNKIVSEKGIATDDIASGHGLAYARLIDFDKNGVPELYLIHIDRNSLEYTQEVWAYINQQAVQLYADSHYGFTRSSNMDITLYHTDKQTYLSINPNVSMGDYYYNNDHLYTVVNQQFERVAILSRLWEVVDPVNGDGRTTYTVNESGEEKQVSETEFKNIAAKYGIGNAKAEEIIDGGAGSPSFAFDVSDNAESLTSWIKSLRDQALPRSLTNVYDQLSMSEKHHLAAFLYHFSDSIIDLRSYTDADVIRWIKDMEYHGKLDANESAFDIQDDSTEAKAKWMTITEEYGEYEWIYEPYSPAYINGVAQLLFGVEVELRDNEFGFYEDGYFYLPSYQYGANPATTAAEVVGLYALGQDMYYAALVVHSTGAWEPDFQSYRNAYETWTEEDKSYIYSSQLGHAVLKKTEGEGPYDWQLVSFHGHGKWLEDNEIKALQKGIGTHHTPDTWAQKEIDEAMALDLVPLSQQAWYGSNITRADFSRLIIHMLEQKTGKPIEDFLQEKGRTLSVNVFEDTSDRAVMAAYALGIVNGKEATRFHPNADITRQEAAAILTRTANVLGYSPTDASATYKDQGNIAAWALDSVAFVSSLKDKASQQTVMGGTGNDMFSPLASFTRQQAIITVKRLFNAG